MVLVCGLFIDIFLLGGGVFWVLYFYKYVNLVMYY